MDFLISAFLLLQEKPRIQINAHLFCKKTIEMHREVLQHVISSLFSIKKTIFNSFRNVFDTVRLTCQLVQYGKQA